MKLVLVFQARSTKSADVIDILLDMTAKICSVCKIEKDISCFYLLKKTNKYESKCKTCKIQWQKSYYENNRDKIIDHHHTFYEKNKEDLIANQKSYYEDNKEGRLEYQIQYAKDHKVDKKDYDKVYRQENKAILNKKRVAYDSNRMKTDQVFRLRKLVSLTIRIYIKKSNSSKNRISIKKYLTYSFKELKDHIEKQFEPWMTWENQGSYFVSKWNDDDSSTWKWQLDHIIPQSDLPYISMEDDNFKKCWALENLRPYSAKQNLLDGATRIRHEGK